MASTDWDGVANIQMSWFSAVTSLVPPVTGSTPYAFGIHNASGVPGSFIGYPLQANYSPLVGAGTGSVRALMYRAETLTFSHSPLIIIHAQSADVLDDAYCLTWEDAEEARLVLKRGPPDEGAIAPQVGVDGVLSISTKTYSMDTWYRFKLETRTVGADLLLRVFEADVSEPVEHPDWVEIADLAVTDIAPLTNGFFGMGMWSQEIGDAAYIDFFEITRHL